MPKTSRWGHPYPELEGSVADVPADIKALADSLDGVAMDDSGTFAARPKSTAESPGKKGRYYFATDQNILYRDTGTSWIAVNPQSGFKRASTNYTLTELDAVPGTEIALSLAVQTIVEITASFQFESLLDEANAVGVIFIDGKPEQAENTTIARFASPKGHQSTVSCVGRLNLKAGLHGVGLLTFGIGPKNSSKLWGEGTGYTYRLLNA